MAETFRSPWLDWAPPAEKGGPETPKHRTDQADEFESVGLVGSVRRDVGPVFSLRVVVDEVQPVPGPVRLDAATVVLHPGRSIAADVASLERVVAGLATARQVGDRHGIERFEDEIEGLVERLSACGCRGRIEEAAQ